MSRLLIFAMAGLALAGPCKPGSSTTESSVSYAATTSTTEGLSASATSTATLTEEETTTFVPSDTTIDISLSSTETSAVETTTIASIDTTGISTDFSTETTFSTIATSTVAETTTQAEPANPLQTVKLMAIGSNDPSLATSGSLGFSSLEANPFNNQQFYTTFQSDASINQLFTINKDTGEVKALNGPSDAVGKSASYNFFPGSGSPYGAVTIPSSGAPALDCKVVDGSGYQYLQCKFGTNQLTDFWTCKQRLVFVYPGYDLTRCAMDGNAYTGYKIPIIQVMTI
ncbi:uncharacterized protein B0J16DRAFT_349435 [Fusarium flagelliforme]|uniref:uncharacterized protein n=1 Tax=Fusarium flagelliforme TaxID=2675880 RepID=UPI001E8D9B92|nr:uncharacterized protein B0J16DRAFT_349435 [Fusarium flagelliforme]KAH7175013.1 hypothetical protein B0J16DRAFT_349435 [Fusarium flagelliforme]